MRRAKTSVDERTRVAYHEAGHAVVAYLHKRPFQNVSIVEDADSRGRLVGAPWRSPFRPDAEVGPREKTRIDATIRMALAGDIAVSLLVGKRRVSGAEDDWEKAYSLAERVYYAVDEVSAFELLRICTRNELSQPGNWAAVSALAEALLEQRTLTVRRAKQIIRAAIEVHVD